MSTVNSIGRTHDAKETGIGRRHDANEEEHVACAGCHKNVGRQSGTELWMQNAKALLYNYAPARHIFFTVGDLKPSLHHPFSIIDEAVSLPDLSPCAA